MCKNTLADDKLDKRKLRVHHATCCMRMKVQVNERQYLTTTCIMSMTARVWEYRSHHLDGKRKYKIMFILPKRIWQNVSIILVRSVSIILLSRSLAHPLAHSLSIAILYLPTLNSSTTQKLCNYISVCTLLTVFPVYSQYSQWTVANWKGKCFNEFILKQKCKTKTNELINFPSTVWYRCTDVTTQRLLA